MCAAGFNLGTDFYQVGCGAVAPELVTESVLGEGDYRGTTVTVNEIDGVDPSRMVAIRTPGGLCNDGDTPLSEWSMAARGPIEDLVCTVLLLRDDEREANGCPDAESTASEPLDLCSEYPVGFHAAFDVAGIAAYGEDHPDTWGGWWVADGGDGPLFLWVTDDPANHTDALDIVDGKTTEFLIADHTLIELKDAATTLTLSQIPGLISIEPNTLVNRVMIEVEADSLDVQAALRHVERDLYCLAPRMGPVTPWGEQAQVGNNWRLLGETLTASPYAVAISSTQWGLTHMWSEYFTGPVPTVDFGTEVVLYFGGVVSTGCPQILLNDIHIGDDLVYSVFTHPGTNGCLRDAVPHGYAVAVARAALPDQFTLQMMSNLPPGAAQEAIDVNLASFPQDVDGWGPP